MAPQSQSREGFSEIQANETVTTDGFQAPALSLQALTQDQAQHQEEILPQPASPTEIDHDLQEVGWALLPDLARDLN